VKILQVSAKHFFPPMDGGKIAALSMAEGLHKHGHTVAQFFFDTPRHPISQAAIPEQYPFRWISAPLDTRIKPLDALWNLCFLSESYNIQRFGNAALASELMQCITSGKYDLIQCESIFAWRALEPLLPQLKVPVVLRAHNVEHRIWERQAAAEKNPLKAWYLRTMATRLKRDEYRALQQVSGVIAISDTDAKALQDLGYRGPITVSGIACRMAIPKHAHPGWNEQQLFHLGAMDWLPNIQGVQWFCHAIWPEIHLQFPEFKFILAGHGGPAGFDKRQAEGIYWKEAPDTRTFMEHEGILVVPLRSGSGIRVKIIEALSLGKVVITTSVGLEGIPAIDGEHLFVADHAEAFIRALNRLKSNPALAAQISENARNFAAERFDADRLTEGLTEFYHRILS
jgi:glycosyltransferase involved in cell wall biosynthesis